LGASAVGRGSAGRPEHPWITQPRSGITLLKKITLWVAQPGTWVKRLENDTSSLMAWTGRERGFCPPGQTGPVRRGAQHEATVAVAVERGRGDGGRCVAARAGQRGSGRDDGSSPARRGSPGGGGRAGPRAPCPRRRGQCPRRRAGLEAGQEDPRAGHDRRGCEEGPEAAEG